ncbi:MAG: DUF4355 domain-containing protein [Dehalococcoidales bacterium]|nr:DUF4355 domain-containing protein [Dehalococcoidales bacterium]
MADDPNVTNAATTTAQQNPGDGGQTTMQQPEKTFTQAELDAIIAERLKRERERYKDFDAYKKAAEEYQKLREAQMSETEKLQAKLAEYERQIIEKEREAAEARLESLRLKVLDEMGLPKAWAQRIFGTTEEEIRQDAEELKKLLGAAGRAVGSGTNPAVGSNTFPDVEALGRMSMSDYIEYRKRLGG